MAAAMVHRGSQQARQPPTLTTGPYPGKRVFDLAFLVITAPISIPLWVLCAIAVRIDSSGPVLFRQQRIGREGRPFVLLKFRSMVHTNGVNALFPDERLVTRVGRFLRRGSLDEIPQLLNVLRGEMSVVGPRPTLPYQVARYSPRQRQRLAVPPGLTGLAQVRGRNTLTWSERIDWDLEYCARASLWLDFKIVFETIGVLVRGTGLSGHPRDDPLAAPGVDQQPQ